MKGSDVGSVRGRGGDRVHASCEKIFVPRSGRDVEGIREGHSIIKDVTGLHIGGGDDVSTGGETE